MKYWLIYNEIDLTNSFIQLIILLFCLCNKYTVSTYWHCSQCLDNNTEENSKASGEADITQVNKCKK